MGLIFRRRPRDLAGTTLLKYKRASKALSDALAKKVNNLDGEMNEWTFYNPQPTWYLQINKIYVPGSWLVVIGPTMNMNPIDSDHPRCEEGFFFSGTFFANRGHNRDLGSRS